MIEDEIRRGVKLEDEDILELQALRWKGPLPGTGAGTGEGEGCGQGGVELDYEAWAELAIVKRKEQLWKKGIDLEAMEVLAGMAVNAWMRNGRRGSGMGETLRRDLFKGVSGGSKRPSWSEDPDPDRYSQVPGRWVEGE